MTPQDRATLVINETYADEYVKSHMTPMKVARALADAGRLMPDLPEPKIDSDGWATWDSSSVTEAAYHSEKGLWTYDDGRMVQDSPERLREVAYIYLAAADYSERNQN